MNSKDPRLKAYEKSKKDNSNLDDNSKKQKTLVHAWEPSPLKGQKSDTKKDKQGELNGFYKTGTAVSKYRKAAKLLLLLGKAEASEVLKHLSNDEIEGITKELASIRHIEKAEAEKLLEEFGLIRSGFHSPKGGLDAAKAILTKAIGEEKAYTVLNKIKPFQGNQPFEFLNDLEYHQVLGLLKNESPRVISSILAYVDPQHSSKIVEALSKEKQTEVIQRLARMEKIDSLVLQKLEEKLLEKIRMQGRLVTEELDGASKLADILKYMDLYTEEQILTDLNSYNPEISEKIRDMVFTFETIFQIQTTDLQKILREFSDKDLALMLKGKAEDAQQRVLRNLSERRRSLILDEMGFLGACKKSDIDAVTKEFLEYIRYKSEIGDIIIIKDDDEFV